MYNIALHNHFRADLLLKDISKLIFLPFYCTVVLEDKEKSRFTKTLIISFLALSDKHLLLIDCITSGLQFSGIINDDTVVGEVPISVEGKFVLSSMFSLTINSMITSRGWLVKTYNICHSGFQCSWWLNMYNDNIIYGISSICSVPVGIMASREWSFLPIQLVES